MHPGKGLSPHARGNHSPVEAVEVSQGSIPACAGKPSTICTLVHPCKVYPRMRGETPGQTFPLPSSSGLSPHARGNQVLSLGATVYIGSIPKCAGKPINRRFQFSEAKVYPRMRGETLLVLEDLADVTGLSPHARGNPFDVPVVHLGEGSIPACAGKPGLAESLHGGFGVYPRMRGETSGTGTIEWVTWGLSPHARGNPPRPVSVVVGTGSIPACAGKPTIIDIHTSGFKVYPRMRGETK